MIDHQGRPDATYAETSQVFDELARLAPIIDATRFVASAALLHSEDIAWAWNMALARRADLLQAEDSISAQGRLLRWYSALQRAKVTVDVLDPLRELGDYATVIVPTLYLINPEIVANLTTYVRGGGTLIVGAKAGLKNWDNVFCTELPPCGSLAELFGTTVKSSPFRFGRGPLPNGCITMASDAPWTPGATYENTALFDNLEPITAQVLARHATGEAAITLNHLGAGRAIYLGCEPEAGFYDAFIDWLIAEDAVQQVLDTAADVEVTLREGGGHRLIFVLNHHAEAQEIVLPKAYRELISDQEVRDVLVVPGEGVCILDERDE